MTDTVAFERSHHILIEAPASAVFDYVTNPHSWPQWIAVSHEVDSADRPLTAGETFREKWFSREEIELHWQVLQADRPTRWVAQTAAGFIGPIIVQYDFEPAGNGMKYTRTVRNPARPKAPTEAMIARIDAEAASALANIKANVEKQLRG
jgi:uncharacterized protein YndB with AHSA1/START domain